MQVQEAQAHDPYGGGENAIGPSAGINWWRLIYRNIIAFAVIGGSWLAVETGYFSNDRTPRATWTEMERLKSAGAGRVVYEVSFLSEQIGKSLRSQGYWDYYNGASGETAAIKNDVLEIKYTAPWIGAYFLHQAFEPSTIYRVVFEAKVEGQPGAILMRNRQLDHMREEIPVTGGEFKQFTAFYVTSSGSLDQTRIIFMPNNRKDVRGSLTIRKFRIEKMGS